VARPTTRPANPSAESAAPPSDPIPALAAIALRGRSSAQFRALSLLRIYSRLERAESIQELSPPFIPTKPPPLTRGPSAEGCSPQ